MRRVARVLAHRQGEQGAVGERELQVLGDENRVEFLALGGLAARDDGDRLDGRGIQALQVAQAVVLVMGDRRTDLLDREHAAGQVTKRTMWREMPRGSAAIGWTATPRGEHPTGGPKGRGQLRPP